MTSSARIHLHGFTAHRDQTLKRIRLVFAEGARWADACWVFEGADEAVAVRGPDVAEIASTSGLVQVVIEAPGMDPHVLEVTGALVGEPQGAHCLLHAPRGDGFWRGHTVATHMGRVVVRRHDYDPG